MPAGNDGEDCELVDSEALRMSPLEHCQEAPGASPKGSPGRIFALAVWAPAVARRRGRQRPVSAGLARGPLDGPGWSACEVELGVDPRRSCRRAGGQAERAEIAEVGAERAPGWIEAQSLRELRQGQLMLSGHDLEHRLRLSLQLFLRLPEVDQLTRTEEGWYADYSGAPLRGRADACRFALEEPGREE